MERKSVSCKKLTPAVNNTYQFKSPVTGNKTTELKSSASKPQLHKNSAIGRTRNPINHWTIFSNWYCYLILCFSQIFKKK